MKGVFLRYGPAVLSGTLLSFAYANYRLTPLAWFALVPLLIQVARLPLRQAALQFFVAGWVFHTLLLQWLFANIMWAGGWALIGQQLLVVALSIYWAVFGGLWAWLRARSPKLGGALALAVIWAAMETLQARLFTGFGWSSLAYTQGRDLYMLQWAALGSGIAISFILIVSNGLLTLAWVDRKSAPVRFGTWIVLVLAAHGVGAFLLRDAEYKEGALRVGVLQSNFPLEMKWDPEYRVEMIENAAVKSRALHAKHPVDLFIWPEALVLADIQQYDVQRVTNALGAATGAKLFTGGQRIEPGRFYNSAFLLDRAGIVEAHYDKIRLAPFGEYVPMAEYLPFVSAVVPSIGGLSAGDVQRTMPVADRNLGPLICFEVIFPDMAESLREKGADVLVVITNLAWFGHSSAIPQELEIARLRAIETRLPLIHSSNTGISGVFDPYGRFSPVSTIVENGQAFDIPPDTPLYARIMQRMVGQFRLPEPGQRPIPGLPKYFPWFCVAVTIVFIPIAAASGTRKPTRKEK